MRATSENSPMTQHRIAGPCPRTSVVVPLALHDAREGWYRGLVVVLQVYTALQVAPSNVQ